ncbi:MAG TPA: uroporphyrinogen-III C-methyltransferase [Actinobacteria bacterium]|nr:uroporphyrinogen-III C-methyltransferase [Actinomycetota bacterium]
MTGVVTLVGAGPGDPDLITVKGRRAIETADVILHDRLVDKRALGWARPRAEIIDVGKRIGCEEEIQESIISIAIDRARCGSHVVRLKGGDPFVFGRGIEECQAFAAAGIAVVSVPGVSSALAAGPIAGIGLTLRGIARSFTVVTGHTIADAGVDWDRYAAADTLVVLMGVANRQKIALRLIDGGRPASEPVVFVENATSATEFVVAATLADVAAGGVVVESPAVWIIGPVIHSRVACLAQY